MNEKHLPPAFNESAFCCPHCQVFARQVWGAVRYTRDGSNTIYTDDRFRLSLCQHCAEASFWHKGEMVYPISITAAPANDDLPDNVKADYNEAALIAQHSPRGAAALLRLAIQKLCKELGQPGKNINDDIGALVKQGLPPMVQQALDIVRVVGNECVHPGTIDVQDNDKIANSLFTLVNLIAEKMITDPKHIDDIFAELPQSKRDAIENRDK